MEVRAVPVIDEHGTVREWVGAHADITDRVKAQEQLGQAQKLQAVGTLAGGVAHEVNNQLMAVLGFGDFVLKELGPNHPQTPDVDEMIRGATRAARVAQQLLTFSRRQVNQTRVMDLHGAVMALVPVLERLLGADKTLVVLPRRSRREVLADPTHVDQVLINLAANARDAMSTGGRLTIGTDDVVLDEAYAAAHAVNRLEPGPYVRLTVSDTGCGMDAATAAKIFEPFFTTKPVGAGTGLGLSTVYGIVKQHDGFIWAYSEPGIGTVMKIYLPAASADAVRDAEVDAPVAAAAEAARVGGSAGGGGRARGAEPGAALARGGRADGGGGGERAAGAGAGGHDAGAARAGAERRHHARAQRPPAERGARAHPARRPGAVHVRLHRRRRAGAKPAPSVGSVHPEAVRARGAGRPGAAAPRERRGRAALAQRRVEREGRARIQRQPVRRGEPRPCAAAKLEVPSAHRPLVQHESAAGKQQPARQHLVRQRGGGCQVSGSTPG